MLNNLHFQKPIRFDSLQHSFFPPLMEIMKVAGRRIVPNIRTCKMHKMNIRRVSLILQVWDYGTKAFNGLINILSDSNIALIVIIHINSGWDIYR